MIESQSLNWCYSIQDHNERRNDYPNINEGKVIPEWFYWTSCVDCREYGKFTINFSPYQPTHNISLSCDNCGRYILKNSIVINVSTPLVMIVM